MERSALQSALEYVLSQNKVPDADELADSIVETMNEEDTITSDRGLLEDSLIERFYDEDMEDPDTLAEEVIDHLLLMDAFYEEEDDFGLDE